MAFVHNRRNKHHLPVTANNKAPCRAAARGLVRYFRKKSEEARTYSPALGSTIGAAGCHGRVRDGNGWSPGAGLTSSMGSRNII